MFETLAQTDRSDLGKRLVTLLISIVLHVVVIIFIVILPLVFFNVLPEGELLTFLIAPPPPPPPPPPSPTKVVPQQRVTVDPTKFVAPTEIPKEIPPPVDEPPVVGVSGVVGGIPGGVVGGVLGGVPGGVVGGVLGGAAPPPPPPPPPRPKKVEPMRVGGNVQESKILRRVDPIYPELAKRARVETMVILEVNVDEEGNVANIRVVRGHPLLDAAATEAVKQWKYSPTLLNGEPVPVIATVTVIFKLGK